MEGQTVTIIAMVAGIVIPPITKSLKDIIRRTGLNPNNMATNIAKDIGANAEDNLRRFLNDPVIQLQIEALKNGERLNERSVHEKFRMHIDKIGFDEFKKRWSLIESKYISKLSDKERNEIFLQRLKEIKNSADMNFEEISNKIDVLVEKIDESDPNKSGLDGIFHKRIDELFRQYKKNLEEQVSKVQISSKEYDLSEVFVDLVVDYRRPELNDNYLSHLDSETRKRVAKFLDQSDDEERDATNKKIIKPNDLLKQGTQVIITGAPGCGKSTLAKYLALKTLQQGKLAILLELKTLDEIDSKKL